MNSKVKRLLFVIFFIALSVLDRKAYCMFGVLKDAAKVIGIPVDEINRVNKDREERELQAFIHSHKLNNGVSQVATDNNLANHGIENRDAKLQSDEQSHNEQRGCSLNDKCLEICIPENIIIKKDSHNNQIIQVMVNKAGMTNKKIARFIPIYYIVGLNNENKKIIKETRGPVCLHFVQGSDFINTNVLPKLRNSSL